MSVVKKILFIHRQNNLYKNRGLHNLKKYFEAKGCVVDDLDMGKIKSLHFLKQFFYLIFKLNNNYDYYVIREPIFVSLLVLFRPDLSHKVIFLSKEMYEFQVPLKTFKLYIRYIIYKNAHMLALKKSPYILFSNDLRRNYYLKKIRGSLKIRSSVFEGYYFNDDSQISFDLDRNFSNKIKKIRKKYKNIFCYAGSLQPGRDIDLFINVFDKINSQRHEDTVFLIAGFDRGNYANKLKGKKNIIFLGALSFAEVHYLYQNSDWGIMHYDNKLLNTAYCAPLKLYEYIHYDIGVISNKNCAMLEKGNIISYYYENEKELIEILNKGSSLKPKTINKVDYDFVHNMDKSLQAIGVSVTLDKNKVHHSKKIFYITRTFPPQNTRGGALMRKATVDKLRHIGWDITVITPNYEDDVYIIRKDSLIMVPLRQGKRLNLFRLIMEYTGIFEDALDGWVSKSFKYISKENIVDKDSVIFATSGGDLASLKLATLLKKKTGAPVIFNYRDPLTGTFMKGRNFYKRKFFKHRDSIEKKYIDNADFIVTANNSIKDNLIDKYNIQEDIIQTNYFGYPSSDLMLVDLKPSKKPRPFTFIYGGTMMDNRKPEILIKAYEKMKLKDKARVVLIGNIDTYPKIKSYEHIDGVELLPSMRHSEYVEYVQNNADVGFLSLADGWYSYCLPSKFYEYIAQGLPILASLSLENEASKITTKQNFGLVSNFNDIDRLAQNMDKFVEDEGFYKICQHNIMNAQEEWSMDYKIIELNKIIQNVAA